MSNSHLQTYKNLISILEEIARRLLNGKISSRQEIWQIETDLINFQTDIQRYITEEKSHLSKLSSSIRDIANNRESNWKERVRESQRELSQGNERITIYRHANIVSHYLADTLAWTLLDNDERKILALMTNVASSTLPTGLSLKGMLAVAEALSSAGLGFPLVHDITNCLRVGDITFVSPKSDPVTVEIKTHVLEQKGSSATLRVAAYAPAGGKWEELVTNLGQHFEVTDPEFGSRPLVQSKSKVNKRFGRQLERLSNAKLIREARMDSRMLSMYGQETLLVQAQQDITSMHWDLVRSLVIQAKTGEGYASKVVDDAMVYVVTYSDSPQAYPWSEEGMADDFWAVLQGDLQAKFPRFQDTNKNHVWFGTTWNYFTGDVPPYIRPFFLYPLPAEQIIDLMWGCLAIMVFVNLGKVVEVLRNSGINARLPNDEKEFSQLFIPILQKVSLPDGNHVEIQLGSGILGTRLAYEYLSLQGFVELVSEILHSTEHAVISKLNSGFNGK